MKNGHSRLSKIKNWFLIENDSWVGHPQRRLVGGWIKVEGCCEGGENCLKYLKSGWNRKEGKGKKDFKKWGQAGPRGRCLKRGGAGTAL